MGIRFFCPNGHKLNVKEFQAGRLGICPFCGVRTQIPMQSTRPGSKSAGGRGPALPSTYTLENDDPDSAQDSDSSPNILPGEPPSLPGDPAGGKMLGPSTPVGIPVGSGPVVAPPTRSAGDAGPGTGDRGSVPASAPATSPVGANLRSAPLRQPSPDPGQAGKADVPLRSAPAQPAQGVPAAVAMVPAAASPGPVLTNAPNAAASPAVAPPAAAEATDPIAEAPEMIWYVRPPSGGQFGPASGELMRSWLSEGRVSADSLVWREGWRDWQDAGTVFPKLRSNQIIDFLETAPVVPVAAVPAAHAHRPNAPRSSDRSQIILLAVLSVAVVVLLFVFLWVLNH